MPKKIKTRQAALRSTAEKRNPYACDVKIPATASVMAFPNAKC
jgi:hypothetical protein